MKKGLVETTKEDFDSLPPALRRKVVVDATCIISPLSFTSAAEALKTLERSCMAGKSTTTLHDAWDQHSLKTKIQHTANPLSILTSSVTSSGVKSKETTAGDLISQFNCLSTLVVEKSVRVVGSQDEHDEKPNCAYMGIEIIGADDLGYQYPRLEPERFRLEQLRLAENDHHDSPNYRSKWSTSGGATLALTGVSHQGPYRPPIRGTSQRRGTPRTGQNSRQARTRSWAGPQSDWHRIQPLAPQGRSPRSSTFLPMQFKVNKFPKRILSQQQQKQRRTKKNNRPSRRLRKPKSVQVAYFVQQADSQWFRSLPPKIQQRDFSREEQKLLLTGCCDNNILDAADKAALYNKSAQTEFSSPFFFPSRSPEYCCSETSSMAASDVMSDSNVTLGDSTIYDSLRWLDEDRDLDLTLDDYHAHVMKSAAPPSKSRRRRPSFARRLSLSSPTFSRTSSMSISNRNNLQNVRNVDGTPKSNIVSSVAPQIGKFTNGSIDPVKPNPPSSTRPMSSYHAPRHVSHGSTSSIDPSAQYYHDPEARLKLRVYLASPQKFDEAVEFGFPSLENKENVRPAPGRSITEPQRPTHDTGRSVPQNDVSSGSNRDQHEKNKRQTQALAPLSTNDVARPLRSKSFSQKMSLDKRSRPFSLMPKGNSNGSGINREMTLKMTLTRPDLRTAGSTGTASPTPKDSDDPLKLAELPPVDENSPAWKTSEEGNGVMKKMWRRIKKYRS